MRIGHTHSPGPADDRARWTRWRVERLLSAGFDADAAERIARQDRTDLHAVLELIDRGCPPHLAERIVAPLDEDL